MPLYSLLQDFSPSKNSPTHRQQLRLPTKAKQPFYAFRFIPLYRSFCCLWSFPRTDTAASIMTACKSRFFFSRGNFTESLSSADSAFYWAFIASKILFISKDFVT